jgi:hypothetical protein
MAFTRTLGRTHPLVIPAGTSANEKPSLPHRCWHFSDLMLALADFCSSG